MENIIKSVLENIEYSPIEIIEKPRTGIYLYDNSPVSVIKDFKKNTVKLILNSQLKEILKEINSKSKKEKQSFKNFFLEEGTRFYYNDITIVEKPEKEFTISFLKNKKIINKKLTAPRRIWIIKKEKKLKHDIRIFAIKEWKEEKTVLYKIPFPNMFNEGKICFGINHSLGKKNIDTTFLDNLYFQETVFTEDNNQIVYKDKEKEYKATEFIEKFSCVPNYENLIEETILETILKTLIS